MQTSDPPPSPPRRVTLRAPDPDAILTNPASHEENPFAVKVAGRHTFDHRQRTHNPMDWDGVDELVSNLALAYLQVYPVERNVVPRDIPTTAAKARQALMDVRGEDFVRELSTATEEAFGIDVVRVGNLRDGLAIEVANHRAIIVGETGNWFFENWSIAHELAHIARGDLSELGTAACDDRDAERAANSFAAELLLPESHLRQLDWGSMTAEAIAHLIWTSGVSTDALSRRLSSLSIAMPDLVAGCLGMKTQTLLRRHGDLTGGTVDPITDRMRIAAQRRFPAHLISAHRQAVEDGKLGTSVLAWMQGVSVVEVESRSKLVIPE